MLNPSTNWDHSLLDDARRAADEEDVNAATAQLYIREAAGSIAIPREGPGTMSKPGDFYLGVLDFFGALLPGAVTLGAAVFLDIPLRLPSEIGRGLDGPGTRIAVFLVLSYVVGQVANGIGSIILDLFYDLLYAPGRGWWSRPETKGPDRTTLHQHVWDSLFSFLDRGTEERVKDLRGELERIAGKSRTGGAYQRVRAYLRVAMPTAFADVEKLEGEQKFFRALTVGAAALAMSMPWLPPGSPRTQSTWLAGILGLLLVFFTRYLALRRKTVERAYTYFSVRTCVSGGDSKSGARLEQAEVGR